MKYTGVLALIVASVIPAFAGAQTGVHLVITIPLPVTATLDFGQKPRGFAVEGGLIAHVAGRTVTISPPQGKPLPRQIRFSSTNTLCFVKGVQRSLTLAAPILPRQLDGVPRCPAKPR